MSRLATIWAVGISVLALTTAIVALTRPQPSTGAGLVDAAKQYIKDLAKQNSLQVDGEKVVAVQQTGDEGIVRIIVKYHPFFQIPGQRRINGPETYITLAVHMHRGQWNAGYANS